MEQVKNIESGEKHQVTHKSRSIRAIADLSTETAQAKNTWKFGFQILKDNYEPRWLHLAKVSGIVGGESKHSIIKIHEGDL